jgi:pyruvate kinase
MEGNSGVIPVNLPNLTQDVRRGDTVLLDDGAIQLRVLGKKGMEVSCRVTVGGVLAEGRGLVVPGMRRSVPFLSDSLRSSLLFAIRVEADYLALSFVNSADDVIKVRAEMAQHNADIPIIAKIERGEAVHRFDSILAVSDGVMVARGDLGVDIPLERVPMVQKELISKCNRVGKAVITATQMLESMVTSARPTRAEVTDVANAILDGTDATMLSAETSIGKRPVQATRTMDRIARETECGIPYEHRLAEKERWLEHETDELIAYSACHTVQRLKAVAIVAYTQSGSTARRVSKYRPQVPILAMTSSDAVSRRLLLYRGVYPFQVGGMERVDDLFADGVRVSCDAGIAKSGDLIVITGGVPIGVTGSTNLLKVEKIN